LGQSAEPSVIITLSGAFRNLHSRKLSEFDLQLYKMFNHYTDLVVAEKINAAVLRGQM
jgi:hypothetical protein